MIEALWTLKFGRIGLDEGAGVMVLETGRVFGGDSSFSFIGGYSVKDETLTASVHVRRHAQHLVNIFGLDEFDLVIKGAVSTPQMRLVGEVVGHPGATLHIQALRAAELP